MRVTNRCDCRQSLNYIAERTGFDD